MTLFSVEKVGMNILSPLIFQDVFPAVTRFCDAEAKINSSNGKHKEKLKRFKELMHTCRDQQESLQHN